MNFHPPALPLLGLCGGPCPSRAPVQLPQVEPSIFQVMDNFSVKAESKYLSGKSPPMSAGPLGLSSLWLRRGLGLFSLVGIFFTISITNMVVFLELITIMMGMLINNDNDLVSFSGISDSLLATIGSVTREGRRPPGHYHHHHHHHHCYQYQDDHRVTAFYPL